MFTKLKIMLYCFSTEFCNLKLSVAAFHFSKNDNILEYQLCKKCFRHNITYRTRAKISSAYSKLTRFLDTLIFEKNQEMLIFDPCLFKKNVKDVKKICTVCPNWT